jgi:hypothetical protein
VTRIGEKCAESSHEYEHGSFRILAYLVDNISGKLKSNLHDRSEWVKVDDVDRYQLLPADLPILAALKKLKGPER